jgi:hypothetical protein
MKEARASGRCAEKEGDPWAILGFPGIRGAGTP